MNNRKDTRGIAAKISSELGMGVHHSDSCGTVTLTVLALDLAHDLSDNSQPDTEGGIEDKV